MGGREEGRGSVPVFSITRVDVSRQNASLFQGRLNAASGIRLNATSGIRLNATSGIRLNETSGIRLRRRDTESESDEEPSSPFSSTAQCAEFCVAGMV